MSVGEDVAALEAFVRGMLLRWFHERPAGWFGAVEAVRSVMWWVPEHHRPTLAEGEDRSAHLAAHEATDNAFGWSHPREAQLRRDRGRSRAA